MDVLASVDALLHFIIYMFICLQIPSCPDYCSFIKSFFILLGKFYNFVLFWNNFLGHSSSFYFHIGFKINLTVSTNIKHWLELC